MQEWFADKAALQKHPLAGCNCKANAVADLLWLQPYGLKSFVDFCGVARLGKTAAGIAQLSRLQKSANVLSAGTMGFNQHFLSIVLICV